MRISDITPGTPVRLTPEWRAQLKTGGVSPGYIERRGRGTVVHVESTPHWDVVTYRIADGTCHVASPDDLERDTSDDATARIRKTAP